MMVVVLVVGGWAKTSPGRTRCHGHPRPLSRIADEEGELEASAPTISELGAALRGLAEKNSSGGGVSQRYSPITPKSGVYQVIVGATAAAGGGGAAAPAAADGGAAPAAEAKKEEPEEEEDADMGFRCVCAVAYRAHCATVGCRWDVWTGEVGSPGVNAGCEMGGSMQ